MITIVLADDHSLVREALRAMLSAQSDLMVVGEAEDGLQAVELVMHLQPDVLVVDLIMPGMNGLDVTLEVCQRVPKTRAVILSMYPNEAYVLNAFKNGASAYVLKCSTADHLLSAIRNAAQGRRYLSPPLNQQTIERYQTRANGITLDVYDTLTRRERQILHLTAEGLGHKEIGNRLGISPRTAETHRANLMQKLGLRSQAEIIHFAYQHGIISPN